MLSFTVFDLESKFNRLLNAIKILGTDGEGIAEYIAGVKDKERRIDEAQMSVTKKILLSRMDYKGIILLIRILDSLQEAADICKGCTEIISILFYAKRI